MSTNIIAISFFLRPPDGLSLQVALALALYHGAPIARAIPKILAGETGKLSLKSPKVHAIAHIGYFVCLAMALIRA